MEEGQQSKMIESLASIISRYNLNIKGAVHLGACKAEERHEYKACEIDRAIWVEANPDLLPIIRKNLYDFDENFKNVFDYAISDVDDSTVDFKIIYPDDRQNYHNFPEQGNCGCSSLLSLGKHKEYYPHIDEVSQVKVNTITLDTLFKRHGFNPQDFEFLNMDLQGAEMKALEGMKKYLESGSCKVIYTELAFEELYIGGAKASEIDEFLSGYGFDRVDTYMAHHSWGDGVYLR